MTRVLCFIRPRSPRRLYKLILTSFLLATYLLASKLSQNCELKPFSSSAINFTQHNVNQNEMKFIAFFAFVATLSAAETIVQFYANNNCFKEAERHSECGVPIIPNLTSESLSIIKDDSGKGIIIWARPDCTGDRHLPVQGSQCINFKNFSFAPLCLMIVCWKVSCLIGVLLFILMRLI